MRFRVERLSVILGVVAHKSASLVESGGTGLDILSAVLDAHGHLLCWRLVPLKVIPPHRHRIPPRHSKSRPSQHRIRQILNTHLIQHLHKRWEFLLLTLTLIELHRLLNLTCQTLLTQFLHFPKFLLCLFYHVFWCDAWFAELGVEAGDLHNMACTV